MILEKISYGQEGKTKAGPQRWLTVSKGKQWIGHRHCIHARCTYFPNKCKHTQCVRTSLWEVSACKKHTRAQQTHSHASACGKKTQNKKKRRWKNLQTEPWLMRAAQSPAVVGVFCLITLSVCFISAWWSLMNELALSVLACPVELSSFGGATWYPTSPLHTVGHRDRNAHPP